MLFSVYLGSKCNMNCAYCHREISKAENGVTQGLFDLIHKCKDKYIGIRFIGGEPSLYLDDIKKVVAEFPNADFHMTTNGKKYTPEMLEYFKEHNFALHISFDGDTRFRGEEPNWELFKDYPRISLTVTVCHGNTDLNNLDDEVVRVSNILGRNLFYMPHPMHETNNENSEYRLTKEDYESIGAQVKARVLTFMGDALEFNFINPRLQPYYSWFVSRYYSDFDYGENYCANPNHLRVDWTGQPYTCSYIRDVELSYDNYKEEHAKVIDSISPACKTCDVYPMCGGGCTKTQTRAYECAYYKDIFSTFRYFYDKNRDALGELGLINRVRGTGNYSNILYLLSLFRPLDNFMTFDGLFFDRFGCLTPTPYRPVPQYSEMSVHEEASRRVKELGYRNILWSGGVDSTYIVCQYIKNKVPFRVFLDKKSINDGQEFYKWLKENKYDLVEFEDIRDSYREKDMIHGYLADSLFSFGDVKYMDTDNMSMENFRDLLGDNADYWMEQITRYGKFVGKPTDSVTHIKRLLFFGCFYMRSMMEMNKLICPVHPLTPFFDTPNFNNISYTQYWDRTYKEGKPEFKQLIGEVTQSDAVVNDVHRTGTCSPSRLPLVESTYHNYLASKITDLVINPTNY